MPLFTIETTYRFPVYRHHTYEAARIDEACRLAIDDDDWSDEKRDYESAGETYVTGIWAGESAAYSGAAQSIPSHYAETPQRIALHFEVLLGLIKVLAGQGTSKSLTAPSGLSAHSRRSSRRKRFSLASPTRIERVGTRRGRRRISQACGIC